MPKILSRPQVKAFYDDFGAKQDKQGWYETPAINQLKEHGDFENAKRVYEVGCGTGKLAAELFQDFLSSDAEYHGIDLSPVMVELARIRLRGVLSRTKIDCADGVSVLDGYKGGYDRYLSCYVLDLLSVEDIEVMLSKAHALLRPEGLICIASLTTGSWMFPRIVSNVWSSLHWINPKIVGGCRPISIIPYLSERLWEIVHHSVVSPYGLSSECIVARRKT